MKKRAFIIILSIVIGLLLIPFIAMQFTTEVDWGTMDFIIMGFLLFGTASLIEFVLRKVSSIQYRILISGLILIALFLIWAELAVGIFGSPFAGS